MKGTTMCTGCSCNADTQDIHTTGSGSPAGEAPSHIAEYKVAGMTCGHCVSSVSAQIQEIPGVERVDVDLRSGNVQIRSEQVIAESDVRSAISDAGYQLA